MAELSTVDGMHVCDYPYKLMFEDRAINLQSYNLETVLAEKLETVIARAVTNPRMRDFYDIHVLLLLHRQDLNLSTLAEALEAPSKKRNSLDRLADAEAVLTNLLGSKDMLALWEVYRRKSSYAADISWDIAMQSVRQLAMLAGLQVKDPATLHT